MAITDQDIRLMASEVLSDTDDSGGRITGNEVIDGRSNNLFPDVSELDRTIGRVNLRKAFPAVLSANRDTYYGVNVIIDEVPVDPNVSVTMFTTGSWTDQRSNAVSRLESYMARGPAYDGYLWDQHIAGQKALLIIQRTDRELPPVGAKLALVKNAGTSSEVTQFVSVTKVFAQDRVFSANGCSNEFTRTVLTCEISDPLSVDMMGGIPHCNDDVAVVNANTKVYETVVADAAKYAGMTTLSDAASMGDFTIKAATIFSQLVPSAQVESAITDARPHGDSAVATATGGQVTITTTADFDSTHALYVGHGIYPGSLSITIGGTVITDRAGVLETGGVQVGTVDYQNGILRVVSGGPDYGTAVKTIAFTPSSSPVVSMQTAAFDVTAESRSGTIVFILDPIPAPGTLSISYMAQGKWYVLRDDGSGVLRGSDSAYGAGTVNYVSGSVLATLGALPDVGSSVICVYGVSVRTMNRSGVTGLKVYQKIQLDKAPVPGTLTVSWTNHLSETKTATDGGNGLLVGDAEGEIDFVNKVLVIAPNEIPPAGAELTIDYQHGLPTEHTSTPTWDGVSPITITLPDSNILPNTVFVSLESVIDGRDGSIGTTITRIKNPPTPTPIDIPIDNGGGVIGTLPVVGSPACCAFTRVPWMCRGIGAYCGPLGGI